MHSNIILEYNETNRSFHFNSGNHTANTFGYQTVDKNVPVDKALYFSNKMETKYGFRRTNPKDLPMKTVKAEWKYFNDVLKLGAKKKEKWI